MKNILPLAILLVLFPFISSKGQSIFLRNGNLVDVEKGEIKQSVSVLVENGKITRIGTTKELQPISGIQTIDCTSKWLMPGLVDAHIHLFQSGGLYTRPDGIDLRRHYPYEKDQQWLMDNMDDLMRRYLRCGITTVIDMGGPLRNFKIRDAYNPKPSAPTIYLTGPLISTYQPDAFKLEDSPIIRANTVEEARELVRRQLPYHPDFIKIWYITQDGEEAPENSFNLDLVKATIDEAHSHKLLVAVHATELSTAKLAVRAGADILVHSIIDKPVDDEFTQLLRKKDVVYIPSITVFSKMGTSIGDYRTLNSWDFSIANPFPLGSLFDWGHLDEPQLEENLKVWRESPDYEKRFADIDSICKANLNALSKSGINIATGTDAGNPGVFHGSSYLAEMEAMQKAGLSNPQILLASTLDAAKTVKKDHEFGSIAIGKRADILVLPENPFNDLHTVLDAEWLINKGVLINPDTLVVETPEILAQKQLNAYNARNLEAFLEPYADSVKLFSFPDKLLSSGKESMRLSYSDLFEGAKDLHCELVNRIVLGNTVIDQEKVTANVDNQPLLIEAIAIYKIIEGKIVEVYFLMQD